MLSVRHIVSINATPPSEIYTLSLHDALPIYTWARRVCFFPNSRRRRPGAQRNLRPQTIGSRCAWTDPTCRDRAGPARWIRRSEEHTSELQSLRHLVCRLLLEKKKIIDCACVE